jgi:glycosyltransferase involved in cell wall biosynthesis
VKDKPATLIILTPGFPINESDTTCLPPQQVFVRYLKKTYPQLPIIILAFQYPFTKTSYIWEGIPVIAFGGKQKTGLHRLLLWIRVYRTLKQLRRQYKLLGILSFWFTECALVGKRFARKYGIRHYVWLLGQDARKNNRYVSRERPDANELIALSDFIQDEFEKNYAIRPAHVIPPGIDTALFDQPVVDRDIDILCAGSLIALKQYAVAVEVIAALKKTYPSIKAVIAGKGPEKQLLEKLIDDLGLAENITLAGELPHRDVLRLMQRTILFLHPSSYEGFGVVCTEALYAGATVISFVKPMKKDIRGWYIVATKEEMRQTASKLLSSFTPHESLNVYPVEESVKRMMKVLTGEMASD